MASPEDRNLEPETPGLSRTDKTSEALEAAGRYLQADLNQISGTSEETSDEVEKVLINKSYKSFARDISQRMPSVLKNFKEVNPKEIENAFLDKGSTLSNQQISELLAFFVGLEGENLTEESKFIETQIIMSLWDKDKSYILEKYLNSDTEEPSKEKTSISTIDFVFENFETEINDLCRRYRSTLEELQAVLKYPMKNLELAQRLAARKNFITNLKSCIPRAQLTDYPVSEENEVTTWKRSDAFLNNWDESVRHFLSHPQVITAYNEARIRREIDIQEEIPKTNIPSIFSTKEINGASAQSQESVIAITLDSIYKAHQEKIDPFLEKYDVDWEFLAKESYSVDELRQLLPCYDEFTNDLLSLLPPNIGGTTDLVNNIWARQVCILQFAFFDTDFVKLTEQQKEDFREAFTKFKEDKDFDESSPDKLPATMNLVRNIQEMAGNIQEYKDIFTHDTRGALSGLAYYECLMPDTNGFDGTQIFEGKDGVDDEENAKKAIFALLHFERICEYLLQGDTPKAEPHSFKELRRTIQSLGFYFEGSESKVEIQEMRETDRANFDRLRLSVNLPLLHRTIFGAINNAFKRGEASKIKIRFEIKGNNLLIHIEDNGRGVNPLLLEEDESGNKLVFNKGVSGDEGTGLGLADTLEKTQYLGGDVDLANNENQSGATTVITLPLTTSASIEYLKKQATNPQYPQSSGGKSRKTPSKGKIVSVGYAGEHEKEVPHNDLTREFIEAHKKAPEDA